MKGRLRGTCSRADCKYWRGLPCDFTDWQDFRTWSLANGYSRTLNSLDRKDPQLGYVKSNLQWVTVSVNSIRANRSRWDKLKGASNAEEKTG